MTKILIQNLDQENVLAFALERGGAPVDERRLGPGQATEVTLCHRTTLVLIGECDDKPAPATEPDPEVEPEQPKPRRRRKADETKE